MKILILTSLGFQKSVSKISNYLQGHNHSVDIYMKKISLDDIKSLNLGLILTHNYKHIITKDIISFVKGKIVNLHPSYLPYCKGVHPFIWSLVASQFQGVTLHFINERIDEGKIIAQKKITLKDDLTLRQGHQIMQTALEDLFIEEWPNYNLWSSQCFEQKEKGTYFSEKNFSEIKSLISNWDTSLGQFKQKYQNSQFNF